MKTYAQLTEGTKESSLVREAVNFCVSKSNALDLGAGSLRNAKYLLAEGFHVIAVDKDQSMLEFANAIQSDSLQVFCKNFKDFHITENFFDLIVGINSLQFLRPDEFSAFFPQIIKGLKKDAILCVTFFGPRDEWSNRADMTFHSSQEIQSLVSGMEVLQLHEHEETKPTAAGRLKHWHIFDLIARK